MSNAINGFGSELSTIKAYFKHLSMTKIVFKIAFEQNATAIILTHNHPSGKLQASDADIQITKKIKTAGQQLDIPVLDHIIITENGYYSFADEGIF